MMEVNLKRLVLAALLGALLSTPVLAEGAQLIGWPVFNVPGEPCQNQMKSQLYTATFQMHISFIQIWNGLDKGTWADVTENVTLIAPDYTNGTILIDGSHDDYVDGGAVRVQKNNFAPNYVLMMPGDQLLFQYRCAGGVHGAWTVIIMGW